MIDKTDEILKSLNEAEEDILNKDTFVTRDKLHQKFWFDKNHLNPRVRSKLVEIVNDFIDGLDIDVDIKDITFTGSLANFSWSRFSDIDLHIIADFSEVDDVVEFVRGYFNSKKSLWNRTHDIKIYGFEVEIYVENKNEPHMATGLYSILQDKWIKEPIREEAKIEWNDVEKKTRSLMDQIDRIKLMIDEDDYKGAYAYAKKLQEKIKRFRKAGLEKEGLHSAENVSFKVLRRNEYIGRLMALKTLAYDKSMSIETDNTDITISESLQKWKDFLEETQ